MGDSVAEIGRVLALISKFGPAALTQLVEIIQNIHGLHVVHANDKQEAPNDGDRSQARS